MDTETIALELVKILSWVVKRNFDRPEFQLPVLVTEGTVLSPSYQRFPNQPRQMGWWNTSDSQEYEWRKGLGQTESTLLFAYREEQESTGFSIFELLYARDVRGPLTFWKAIVSDKMERLENVISYIMMMKERLEAMSEHVHKNMKSAQTQKKSWYDKNAWHFSLEIGVYIQLPYPSCLPTLVYGCEASW